MNASVASPSAYKNSVLASLPAQDMDRLAPHLLPVTLKFNRTLHSPGQLVDTVYFLEDGICSVVVTMENGGTVEVGITGRDGFVGIPAVMGTCHSPNRSFIQIPGSGFSVQARVLRQLAAESEGFRFRLLQYVHGMQMQTSQTAACNRVHELDKRLARWLLMCQDRVQSDQIPVTQEILAMMLGTRRSTVTVTAGILSKAGLISHSRGWIRVQNRKGLEKAACECYRVIHSEFVRLSLL